MLGGAGARGLRCFLRLRKIPCLPSLVEVKRVGAILDPERSDAGRERAKGMGPWDASPKAGDSPATSRQSTEHSEFRQRLLEASRHGHFSGLIYNLGPKRGVDVPKPLESRGRRQDRAGATF